MLRKIPSVLGLLTLSITGTGCSDAQKVANTLEKVCKKECECTDMDLTGWNEVKYCKQACEGYATLVEAQIKDELDTLEEPCDELGKRLKDIEKCTKESCGTERDVCLLTAYEALTECWDFFAYDYYYYPLVENEDDPGPGVNSTELVQQLIHPIPGAIDPAVMHAATQG